MDCRGWLYWGQPPVGMKLSFPTDGMEWGKYNNEMFRVETEKNKTNLLSWGCRPHRCISSCQSYSTFSSENFSVSDGEEGNTSDHSNSPDELATRLEDQLAEKLEDMLSQTPEIPIDISTQSDGLSDKECAVRRVKTQMSLGKLCAEEHGYEVHGTFSDPLLLLGDEDAGKARKKAIGPESDKTRV